MFLCLMIHEAVPTIREGLEFSEMLFNVSTAGQAVCPEVPEVMRNEISSLRS